jgi:hypothetical protein
VDEPNQGPHVHMFALFNNLFFLGKSSFVMLQSVLCKRCKIVIAGNNGHSLFFF